MFHKYFFKSLILIFLGFFAPSSKLFSQNNEELMNLFHKISSNEIQSWVKEMIDPKYKGRLAGSPEFMDVAKWSAALFKQWDIQPLGDSGSYFQYFNRPWCNVLDAGNVILRTGKLEKKLIVKEEYYPGANPANGKVKTPVVFAGFGITYPEMNYDDYKDIDVKGKIVLIAGDVPYNGKNIDTSAMWTFYNSHRFKYTNAYKHGAAGVILVDMMASPGTPHYENFYYASVNPDVAKYILIQEKYQYDSVIKKISTTMHPFSFLTKTEAEIKTHVVFSENGQTANVIGFIEGNDPVLKDEVIIIGAHLDGQGNLGFLLPSALDNASGTADVLAATKALSFLKGKMKRSVMIILFGGEECGLLGSYYYVKNPKMPLGKIKLMINLDMVGNGTDLGAWGGQSYPMVLKYFEQNNEKFIHRKFLSSENKPVKGRPRSDGLVFLLQNIPTIHLGITNKEYPVYYHNYKDTMDLLSWEAMEDASKLLFLAVYAIANATDL